MARNKKNKRETSGLTIIELLVANAIAAMAFVVLFYVSFTIQDNIDVTSSILGISEKGRFAVDNISRGIREAELVLTSSGSYITDNDTIVLRVPAIGSNGNVLLNSDGDIAGYDTIIYEWQASGGANIIRQIITNVYSLSSRSATSIVVADGIDSLLFSSGASNLSAITDKSTIDTVTIKVKTSTTTAGGRENEVITSASLRNK